MSAKPMTKSKRKLTAWEISVRRDRRAKELMDREGISFSEAVARVMDEEERCELPR